MKRVARAVAGALVALPFVVACQTSELVVGDDSTEPDGGSAPDASTPDAPPPIDGGSDASPDAEPGTCASVSGTCVAAGAPCRSAADAGAAVCPKAGDVCCLVPCPQIAPPGPGFCDGGPVAASYAAFGCVVGYACAPVDCASAGGQCVGISPSACPNGSFGDAAKYSCGGGLGVGCCLP